MKEAKSQNLNMSASFKHLVEIGKNVKGKKLAYAMSLLKDVAEMKRAIKYYRHRRDIAHQKGGLSTGGYPTKAAKETYAVLNNALANAISNGLDADKLYIHTFITHRIVSRERTRRKVRKVTGVSVVLKEDEKKEDEKK